MEKEILIRELQAIGSYYFDKGDYISYNQIGRAIDVAEDYYFDINYKSESKNPMKKMTKQEFQNYIISEAKKLVENHSGSMIDFEGVSDSLINMLISNEFSESSQDEVYVLAKKTVEGRDSIEKNKLYKTIANKLQNFTKAYPEASNLASQYYYIANRLESEINVGIKENTMKKMTKKDFQNYIISEATKLYKIEVLKEEKERIIGQLNAEERLSDMDDKSNYSMNEDSNNLRGMLHTLVGNARRLEKRADMSGGVSHHVDAYLKAEQELAIFLKQNPSMMEFLDDVEDHFMNQLYK